MVENHTSGEGICLWGYVLEFEKQILSSFSFLSDNIMKDCYGKKFGT